MLFIQSVVLRQKFTRPSATRVNSAPVLFSPVATESGTPLRRSRPSVATVFLSAPALALTGAIVLGSALPAHAKKSTRSTTSSRSTSKSSDTAKPADATQPANSSELNQLSAPPGTATASPVTATASASTQPLNININGKNIDVQPAPVMTTGAILVPLRGVLENLGAKVAYNEKEGRIEVTQNNQLVVLRIGQTNAVVGTKLTKLTAAPQLIGGSTFVPLRSLAELFGYSVQWTPSTRLVEISNIGPRSYADHRAALRSGGPFGVTVDFTDATDAEVDQLLDAAKKAGAGMIKTRFDWATLEPTKGAAFQWPLYDRVVKGARDRNLVVVGILGVSAKWATVFATGSDNDQGDLLYGAPRESNYPAWQNYVKRVVGRYKGDVHAWQVWENPASEKFRSVPRVYRDVVRLAVESAQQADSTAIIDAAEPGGVNLSFIDEMKANGLLTQLDGVELYPTSQQQPGVTAAPEDFLLPFATLREKLASNTDLHATWIGGLTWPVLTTLPNGVVPEAQFATQDAAMRDRLLRTFTAQGQADYLMRAATLALGSGVGKIFWGALRDASTYDRVEPINPEYDSGLLTRDFTPRPSYAAFQTLTRLVSDKPFVGPLALGPEVVALAFDNREQTNIAAWAVTGHAKLVLNSSGADPKVPGTTYVMTLPTSQVLDSTGKVIGGSDGTFDLTNRPVWITNIALQTSNVARGKGGGKPLRMAPRQVDYSTANEVKVDFAERGGENGVFWRKYANFRGAAQKLVELDGHSALVTEISRDIFNPGAGKPFIFLDVADSYLYFGRGVPVTVTIQVHRGAAAGGILGAATGGFNLQYDSPTGLKFTNWQEVETGKGWTTYTFKIPDASFANRDGYDFKINTLGSKQDIAFGSITVRRDDTRQAEAAQPATPVQ